MTESIKAPDKWFNDRLEAGGGFFDKDSLDMALSFVTNFQLAVDCGAHVGSWARPLSLRFDKVIAFEPNPVNFQYLSRNMADVRNSVELNAAVGEKSKTVCIADGRNNSGQSHVSESGTHRVSCITLDEALPEYSAERLGFLKLDLEGYELNALIGAEELLEAASPVVLVELNGLGERYGVPDSAVKQFLLNLGYEEVAVVNKDHIYKKPEDV